MQDGDLTVKCHKCSATVIKEYNHNTTSLIEPQLSKRHIYYKLDGSYLQILPICSQSKWNCSCLVAVVSRSLRLWDSEKSALGLKV